MIDNAMEDSKLVIDVIMPMLGDGTRMEDMQDTCKPLYKTPDGEYLFFEALSGIKNQRIRNLVLIVKHEYEGAFSDLSDEINRRFHPESIHIFSENPTESQLETFMVGLTRLASVRKDDIPVMSIDCDISGVVPEFKIREDAIGHLFCFKHNNPNKCFVDVDEERVVDIAEKEPISNNAVFGAYIINDNNILHNTLDVVRNGKSSMSDLFKFYLENNKKITWSPIESVVNYGTREEYEEAVGDIKKYKALMFDFDGTLFDTYSLTFKAYQLAYFDLGYSITREMFDKTRGFSVNEFNDIMGIVGCNAERLKELKSKYYKDMVALAEPNRYLIDVVKNSNIPTCLVTTSRMASIESLIEKYGLEFDVVVTGDSITKHKPDPECYLTALRILNEDRNNNIRSFECLAFEDSRPGFVSARAAGMDCVMMGEFRDDCIKDMSGGSDARTQLIIEDNSLVVRKISKGETPILHLKKQYEKLYDERNNKNYVNVLGCGEIEDSYYYDMPYIIAPNLYDYINKIRIIPELLDVISNNISDDVKTNDHDIVGECFERYVSSGKSIYEEVTGEEFEINIDDIPGFVNSFRLTPYHGDCIFENVLIKRDNGDVLFIDPVPIRNAVTGVVFDCSKILQSLMGYEAIRRGEDFDYRVEKKVFQEHARELLTKDEFNSLKFHTACLFMRRLKYQVKQDKSLVKVYGDIAKNLFEEFISGNYELI